ncbi:AMP-binding protein [Microscilla marina]|uniref:AMP-binding protein n=1 Tax=Microscilla marina ATCC 23134 TaxID=313606 RepID=A1ZFB2_MICM2|nr:AMP-binding protein [Microscilla marina]EAY30686.1 AMP-binding protein [Microscilla marina ATCC 23134]
MKNHLETHIEAFYRWEKQKAQQPFLRQPYGKQWKTLTYAEAGQEARRMVSALQAMGLQKGDHVGILSKNCYHWILTDLAIMMGGFVSVPFYASLPADQLKVVVEKSHIKALFLGKLEEWDEDKSLVLPSELKVIRYPHYEGNARIEEGEAWTDLVNDHEPMQGDPLPDPDDLWTILFTSGTTGQPKGVMHTYGNLARVFQAEFATNWIGIAKLKAQRFFSFLPLNHVGERVGIEGSCLYIGGTMSFGESLDTFAHNLQQTQPTVFFAVPRIWTKFQMGVLGKMSQERLDLLLKIPIVSGFVKKKIRKALGMGSVEVVATGAAITPEHLKQWFLKLGIRLREAYGMTEVCGSITNTPKDSNRPGSVGKVIPLAEIKIHPDTGEVLMKSPQMMTGYYNEPEKTAEVLKGEWLSSGDKGVIDEDGFLHIVGRVKDAFKTSKGKYIVPNPYEEALADNDVIEQVCVAGLGLPNPIVLVNLSEIGQAIEKEKIETRLREDLSKINESLPGFQKLATLVITQETWSEANNLLTPTMKIRRSAIDDRYATKYEQWFNGRKMIVWE